MYIRIAITVVNLSLMNDVISKRAWRLYDMLHPLSLSRCLPTWNKIY